MPCTEEQYNRDLKEGLEKLGYKMNIVFGNNMFYIGTNFDYQNYIGGTMPFSSVKERNRHFIPEYNPELFLAIAGMREGYSDCAEGEYLYFVKGNSRYKVGEIYRCAFSAKSINREYCRKATLSELTNHFKKEKMYTLEDLKNGKVLMERSKNIDELNDVLGYLSPNDTRKAEGAFPYYFFSHGNWGGASVNLNNKPTQSVALFHDQLPKKETKIEHKTNNQRFEELERNYTELQGAVKDMRKSFDDFKKGMEERVNPVKSQKERLIEMLEKSYYNAIDLCGLWANVKTVVTINTTTYELERLIKELKS